MSLAVTDIETWIRDPYALYARRILRFEPLDPLGRRRIFPRAASPSTMRWPNLPPPGPVLPTPMRWPR
ncbi:hypothetical protein A6302_04340 [Methylobrevis pamukkalensis]|uniref:Uncharacterized protein n=1 Tax=Methylobrevis pamukkalensis TaxID=1439726 RepID=A0A1E3GWP0_9HYPH|nr:hypothetical protein A6302_04340 [Methylobrevis pamukkalensis]